jgi:YHS domain-containing protein
MFAFLARLIVFLIVISVIRSVVEYIKRLWNGSARPRPVFRPPNAGGTAQPSSSTLLQQDPICGTYVAVDTSLKKIIAGRVYHFCSAECRNRFTA